MRALFDRLSQVQRRQGFTPVETTTFVLSLKEPPFALAQAHADKPLKQIRVITQLIDKLALYSMEAFMAGCETVIREQQQSMLELATPMVELWR